MAVSSKDIETLWKHYTEVECKRGVSVAQYFESNGVPYRVFEKWYKKRNATPHMVDCVVKGFSSEPAETPAVDNKDQSVTDSDSSTDDVNVSYVNIRLGNGIQIEHRKLSYEELVCFIKKIQPLCSA